MLIIRQTLKTTGAFCTAFCLLTLMFAFYGLIPVHIDNPQGNTDYVWPPHARWMKMSEGVSWGRLDANGFNNKAVIDNPDILILLSLVESSRAACPTGATSAAAMTPTRQECRGLSISRGRP